MTEPTSSPVSDAGFELEGDGFKLTSFLFGLDLYTSKSFYAVPKGLLDAYDLFLKMCPPERLTFHATETMKVHKPVTPRVLDMPRVWLAPGASRKHYLALELKACAHPQDAATAKFFMWSHDESEQANVLSIALPAHWAREHSDAMFDFVHAMADVFPFRCGLGGYSFDCSRYDRKASESHAWSVSMRHPGINISRLPFDAKAVGSDGAQGVNWLTLLDRATIEELGGQGQLRSKLPSAVALADCRQGTILRIGPVPATGDVNRGDSLPLYREVYRLIGPMIERAAQRSMAFRLTNDAVERTEAWYRRLAP